MAKYRRERVARESNGGKGGGVGGGKPLQASSILLNNGGVVGIVDLRTGSALASRRP